MTGIIEWNVEGVQLPALDYQLIDRWIEAVAQTYGRLVRSITYVFCNDEEILRVNRQFLQHDYYTDIITFDTCTGKLLRGDIFISLDTVSSNAEGLGVDPDRELLRVIIHGILHLCGEKDKGPGERELMENAENKALALYDKLLTQHTAL